MDKAHKQTDKRIKKIEKQLDKIYSEAKGELEVKWKKFMSEQNAYIKDLGNEYYNMKRLGFVDEAKELGKQIGIAKRDRTLYNKFYKDLVNETTRKLARTNQSALEYINGEMPWVYEVNYNQTSITAGKIGVRFDLINEDVVKRRVADGDIKLPKKKISIPKDMRWNTKKLNSSVLQGIIQGESMDKIAERILPIVDNNKNASIRNARTMVTGAENQGRLDSYKQLEDSGIILKKVWMATHDKRVRRSHQMIDGEECDIHEEFSNGLMFPGDTDGDPEEVYNCRCTMVTEVIGFEKSKRI